MSVKRTDLYTTDGIAVVSESGARWNQHPTQGWSSSGTSTTRRP